MKILFICDEPPFPPRNGVTIPSSSYIKIAREKHDVHLCVLESGNNLFKKEFVAETDAQVNNVTWVKRGEVNKIRKFLCEIFYGIAFFHSWKYSEDEKLKKLKELKFDVIISTPIGGLDYAFKVGDEGQKIIAVISDCYTAVLRTDKLDFSSASRFFSSLIRRVRGFWMGRVESKILKQCNNIVVQTKKDADWVRKIGGKDLFEKTKIISNGVDKSLFDMPFADSAPSRVVLFVTGSFQAHYAANLEWFIINVWVKLKNNVPGVRFVIVGRGLENYKSVNKMVEHDDAIEVKNFVPNLGDVYAGSRVAIAPIFKGYGFMNKVAEALAVGVPVVGDETAFNGLDWAVKLEAAFIAKNPEEFCEKLERILVDDEYWLNSAQKAKSHSRAELSWGGRAKNIYELIES